MVYAYVTVVVGSLVSQLFSDPQERGCPDCPRNLLLVHSDAGVWSVVSVAGDVLLITILLPAVVLIVRHVRRASGPARQAMAPVLLAAAAAATCLGALLVVDALGGKTEGTVLLWVGDVVFAAIPVAFLVGLLRTRLQRSGVADLVVELGSLPPPGAGS